MSLAFASNLKPLTSSHVSLSRTVSTVRWWIAMTWAHNSPGRSWASLVITDSD